MKRIEASLLISLGHRRGFRSVLHYGTARSAPGLGGHQAARHFPARFGQVRNTITPAENFGEPQRVNDFFNVTLNARMGGGLQFGGVVNTGRTVNDACFEVDSPGVSATGLPGVRRNRHAVDRDDDQRRAYLPRRDAIQRADAAAGVCQRPAAAGFRRERRVVYNVFNGSTHSGVRHRDLEGVVA